MSLYHLKRFTIRHQFTIRIFSESRVSTPYSWISARKYASWKSILKPPRRATKIPRPPPKSSRRDASRGIWSIFFLKIFPMLKIITSGEMHKKIYQMPRDAPRRDVFARGLGIFVARRGGFIIDFEWAQKVQNIRVFWAAFCKKHKTSKLAVFPSKIPPPSRGFASNIVRRAADYDVYFTRPRTHFRNSCTRRF